MCPKSDLKTKPTRQSPNAYIKSIDDYKKRKDCITLMGMLKKITGHAPKMWGTSIIGYGQYHYQYKSGREGDWFITGFAPRKQNLTIYIMPGFSKYQTIMKKLGKYKLGVSCLYVKSLDDIDQKLLHELISKSVEDMKKIYDCT